MALKGGRVCGCSGWLVYGEGKLGVRVNYLIGTNQERKAGRHPRVTFAGVGVVRGLMRVH